MVGQQILALLMVVRVHHREPLRRRLSMDVVDKLLELNCPKDTHDYIGDGIYVGVENSTVWLVTERFNRFDCIAFDSATYSSFRAYLNRMFKEPNKTDGFINDYD
jgi:hypothetical protein